MKMFVEKLVLEQAMEALESFLIDELRPYEAAKTSADLKDALAQQGKPVVSVDELANHIRVVNGNNILGAGALAEKIVEFLIERGIGKESCDAGLRASLLQSTAEIGKNMI